MAEPLVEPSRAPIFDQLLPHPFVPSEFAPESGRCDTCGGGPDAAIHNHVDPMERLAVALERVAVAMEECAGALHRIEDRISEWNGSDGLGS